MAEPFLGEIRLFGFNFAPQGWAQCNGQLLSIQQNAALFSLLGTMFGGNGIQTFALPDLQGRVALGQGNGAGLSSYVMGEVSGTETVTLNNQNMPAHNHPINGAPCTSNDATDGYPNGNIPGVTSAASYAAPASANGTMPSGTIGISGGSQPHENMQPYLVANYCIALQGIYPSRN